MSYESQRDKFSKERIHVVEIDTPRCVNTWGSAPCTADQHIIRVTVTTGEFQVGDEIEESGTAYLFNIIRISRIDNTLVISVDPANPANLPSTGAVTYTNNTRTGTASKGAGALEPDKCYNSRPTCQDLANYEDTISETTSDYGNVTMLSVFSGGVSRSLGGWGNYSAGDIVTMTGWSNAANNRDYLVLNASGIYLELADTYGCVASGSESGVTITVKNKFTYYHCTPRAPHPQNMNNYFPCVESVSMAPATVDPKGGIGARASATVSMTNFPNSDRNNIDPYLTDRTYTPFETSLYWLKWRTRHADYENFDVRIRSGYIVDNTYDEANFETRHYVMSGFSVSPNGASLKLKDPIQNLSNKKSLAPAPSNGLIGNVGGITAGATSITLIPAGIGNSEYPDTAVTGTFYVKIGSEVLAVTTRSGDTLTVTRGQFNTTAVAHNENDTVQLCLQYTTNTVDEIQYDLLTNYANISAALINGGDWAGEAGSYINLAGVFPDTLITDPTEVKKLVMELCEQFPHKLFWNERTRLIQMSAIKPPPLGTAPLDDTNNLLELTSTDKPELQLSTVFVFYGRFDPTKKLDDLENYEVTYARVNTDAIARYDSNNTKTIYSRWIKVGDDNLAKLLAGLHGRRFGYMPQEINFLLEDKDSELWLGDLRKVNTYQIVDQNGYQADTMFEIVSAAESEGYQYKALEYNYDVADANDVLADAFEVIEIQGFQYDYNMLNAFEAVYGTATASTKAKFIVYPGAVVGSTSTGTPAMQTGTWPVGATVTLEVKSSGYIVGKGGDGWDHNGGSPTTATAGGDALSLAYNIDLINAGTIGGGGGGGGHQISGASSIAGGGGQGSQGGVGGANNVAAAAKGQTPGEDGRYNAPGAGGIIDFLSGGPISGGDGGALGFAGETKSSAGGAAGKAIDLNGNTVTYITYGTIAGAIS